MQRGAGQGMCKLPHIFDRAVSRHQRQHPVDILLASLVARPQKQPGQSAALVDRAVAIGMHEQQASLALQQIAVGFLAVAGIGCEVQQIAQRV